MRNFVLRRLAWAVVLLLAISLVTFLIFYVFPGADPALIRAGRQPTPELIQQIRTNLGLDRSIAYQYVHYVNRLIFHFDFGRSYYNGVAVRNELFSRFPVTAFLTAGAAVLWLLIGLSAGILSALRPRSRGDRAAMGFALFGISAPTYWLGLVSLYLFSKDGHLLRIFPGQGSCVEFNAARCASGFVLPWI